MSYQGAHIDLEDAHVYYPAVQKPYPSPNLWAGVGLLRRGAATSLVGDPETIAQRMREYAELGIETFILRLPASGEGLPCRRVPVPLLPLANAEAARTFRLPLPKDQAGNEFRPWSTRSS